MVIILIAFVWRRLRRAMTGNVKFYLLHLSLQGGAGGG
jgi:hypothetical protein